MKKTKVKIDNQTLDIVSDAKPLQIYGAEKMFNECYKAFYDCDLNEGFYYCGGLINSESFSNELWDNRVKIENNTLSFLVVTKFNDLLAICHSGIDCDSEYIAYSVSCVEFHELGKFKLNI